MKNSQVFLLGMAIGAVLCAAGLSPFILASMRQGTALTACTEKMGHQTKRLAAYESGWTLVYDHQERPAIQVLHGLGQISFGAAVPGMMALRWAIPAHIPVMVSGEANGAEFMYYDPATHQATAPFTPMQFQPAALAQ